jgi:hypothetical protein
VNGDDIVERLRGHIDSMCMNNIVCGDAADEIERLTKERDGWQATAAGLAQDISNADDEIERLRAEASRSCIDCASGVPRQRNEPGEVVVSCRGPLRGNAFMMPFFCSRWEARRER